MAFELGIDTSRLLVEHGDYLAGLREAPRVRHGEYQAFINEYIENTVALLDELCLNSQFLFEFRRQTGGDNRIISVVTITYLDFRFYHFYPLENAYIFNFSFNQF